MAEYFTKDGDEFKKVDDTLFTQDEIDTTIMPKRLERERSKFADYETLKEKAAKVDTVTKDFEVKLTAASNEKTDLEKQLGEAKLDTEKGKIVGDFKLSDELAEFVTGDNADQMRERAEKLSKGFKGKDITLDKKDKPKGKPSDSKSIANALFGKNSDD